MDNLETSPPFKRHGFEPGPTYELQINGQILVYANRILEYFWSQVTDSWRWHVDHVAVEMKPKRNGDISLRIGMARDGGVFSPATLQVPADRMPDVEAFFDILKKERSQPL